MNNPAFDIWFARARAVRIEQIAERRGIKLHGKVDRCGPCPVCGGHDRFSINTAKQVYNCRQCGAKGHGGIDFTAWLDGIEPIPAAERLNGEPPPKANGKDHIPLPREVTRATFVYEDESGETLFAVGRIEFQNPDGSFVLKDGKRAKKFRQKRPDPDKAGEWIYNIDGVRVVPYRLPELIEALGNGHPVLIVEGEAKVDLLRKWNVPATCCSQGAKHWTAAHSEFLRGAEVAILPDNDAAGRDHADAVGASLQGIATNVRMLELPGLGPKGDIVDWIKAGGTVEQLHHLMEHEAKPWAPRAVEAAEETKAEQQRQEEQPQANGQEREQAAELGEWDAGDDPGPIPPRQWLLANQFCCGFISSIVAAGGGGKTALRLLQFISLALGRSLCGQHVFRRCRVLLISLEDGSEELQRRIKAVLDHYHIDRGDLKGWLFCATPKLAKLAQLNGKTRVAGPLEQQLRAAIARRKPDIMSLDPFVKTHALEENSSGDMDFVCDLLARVAVEFDIAVDSPHHVHKGAITPGDADSGRGSSGIRDAGRLIYTLAPMSEDEARTFGIPTENRRSYVRLDSAKVNIAAQTTNATWFRLIGVPIGNATAEYPHGDTVQVVEPWEPPETWAGVSPITLNAALDEIDQGLADGQRYSGESSAKDLAAWPVVARHCPSKTEGQCREIIRTWLKTELLYKKEYDNPIQRKTRQGLYVDPTKRPSL
jgi:hypothetical protein